MRLSRSCSQDRIHGVARQERLSEGASEFSFLIWIPSKNHGHTVKSTVPQVMPCMTRRGYEQKEWRIGTLVVATTLA